MKGKIANKKNLLNVGIIAGILLILFCAFYFRKEADTAITERDIINKELEISEEKVKYLQAGIDSVEKLLQASRLRQNKSKDRQQENTVKFNEEKDKFHRLDDGGHVIFWKNEFSRKDTIPM